MISVITQNDVDYSSLEQKDIGKYCIIVQGCYHLFDSENDALEALRVINRPAQKENRS